MRTVGSPDLWWYGKNLFAIPLPQTGARDRKARRSLRGSRGWKRDLTEPFRNKAPMTDHPAEKHRVTVVASRVPARSLSKAAPPLSESRGINQHPARLLSNARELILNARRVLSNADAVLSNTSAELKCVSTAVFECTAGAFVFKRTAFECTCGT
ncbi:MAG TPA: hypothetical protein VGF48_20670 [Thermoanaerobaculia bacterium]|jgi:hypothetical protein